MFARTPFVATLSLTLLACSCGDSNPSVANTSSTGVGAEPPASASASSSAAAVSTAPVPSGHLLLERERPSAPKSETLPSYRVTQTVDPEARTVAGEITATFRAPPGEALSEVPLVLYANAAIELGADPAQSPKLTIVRASSGGTELTFQAARPSLVLVQLKEPAQPDTTLRITVAFEGTLRPLSALASDMFAQATDSMGSLTSAPTAADYGLLSAGDGFVTLAGGLPIVAPYRDGTFDTSPPGKLGDVAYGGISNYEVETQLPEAYVAVSNLVDASRTHAGKTTTASRGTHVRDFVLVAATDFETSRVAVGPVSVRSTYKKQDAERGERALNVAAESLKSFEKRFGPYPYTELDVVEAPLVGGAGGVEFSGLVLIASMLYRPMSLSSHPLIAVTRLFSVGRSLFGDDSQPDPFEEMERFQSLALDFTVAHEVAHQYFAGLVGNDSRMYPSLDEPLAQYAAGLVMRDMLGPDEAERVIDANVKLNYAAHRMLGGKDGPVLRDTSSFTSAVEYAGLVYGKAPYLYFDLEKVLGPTRLQDAIRAAIAEHRYSIISVDQWVEAIATRSGPEEATVRALFDRYLKQAHGDIDLGVDDSGDLIFDALFPPEMAEATKESMRAMGVTPGELFRGMLSGDKP